MARYTSSSEEDYGYDSHCSPKGPVAHILDVAGPHEPERYEEREKYTPERWLDETSPNVRACLTEHSLLKGRCIFGRGKRACPGQDLAHAELIVICGKLLKFFTLNPALGSSGKLVWLNPGIWMTNVIGRPLLLIAKSKFEIRQVRRNKNNCFKKLSCSVFTDTFRRPSACT